MTTQAEIDAIDETKPSGSGVPRTGPIRQNFEHIKTALQGLLDEIDGLSGSTIETGVYVPVVMGGFVDDLVTMYSGHKVPRLVCMNDGRVVMCKLGENL